MYGALAKALRSSPRAVGQARQRPPLLSITSRLSLTSLSVLPVGNQTWVWNGAARSASTLVSCLGSQGCMFCAPLPEHGLARMLGLHAAAFVSFFNDAIAGVLGLHAASCN